MSCANKKPKTNKQIQLSDWETNIRAGNQKRDEQELGRVRNQLDRTNNQPKQEPRTETTNARSSKPMRAGNKNKREQKTRWNKKLEPA